MLLEKRVTASNQSKDCRVSELLMHNLILKFQMNFSKFAKSSLAVVLLLISYLYERKYIFDIFKCVSVSHLA